MMNVRRFKRLSSVGRYIDFGRYCVEEFKNFRVYNFTYKLFFRTLHNLAKNKTFDFQLNF